MKPSAFLGLRSAIYNVPDVAKARAWYRDLLGVEPYFDQPFYVGFNVGGFELGLHPGDDPAPAGPGGGVPYWGVASLDASWKRVLEQGATQASAPADVGGGIRVAVARDPFGNLLGLIENPHFPNEE